MTDDWRNIVKKFSVSLDFVRAEAKSRTLKQLCMKSSSRLPAFNEKSV